MGEFTIISLKMVSLNKAKNILKKCALKSFKFLPRRFRNAIRSGAMKAINSAGHNVFGRLALKSAATATTIFNGPLWLAITLLWNIYNICRMYEDFNATEFTSTVCDTLSYTHILNSSRCNEFFNSTFFNLSTFNFFPNATESVGSFCHKFSNFSAIDFSSFTQSSNITEFIKPAYNFFSNSTAFNFTTFNHFPNVTELFEPAFKFFSNFAFYNSSNENFSNATGFNSSL